MSERNCPDDGACHHDCKRACFRVLTCGPLSDVYPNDDWPEGVLDVHRAWDEADDLEARLREAVVKLEGLNEEAKANTYGSLTHLRLAGKIEGVKLALSYIEEGRRVRSN